MRLSFVAFTVATCHAWTQPAKLTARRASARMQAATLSEDAKVPVTILTGFLGSGKTTLLNHILTRKHGKKLAIIENEFGDVGIDDALLKENMKEYQDEEIIEMMNGCICCTVRQDLIVVLEKLQKRVMSGSLKLDGIVIETTGMADPAPVAQTFFVDETVQQFCRLDGIVTLVDVRSPRAQTRARARARARTHSRWTRKPQSSNAVLSRYSRAHGLSAPSCASGGRSRPRPRLMASAASPGQRIVERKVAALSDDIAQQSSGSRPIWLANRTRLALMSPSRRGATYAGGGTSSRAPAAAPPAARSRRACSLSQRSANSSSK